MLGTIVNTIAVLIGGSIGLLLKKGLSEKIADTIMKGLGLCTLYIGVTGIIELKEQNTLFVIFAMAVGALVGEWIDLDEKLNRFSKFVEKKFQKNGSRISIAEGFMSACLLFCVGAMTIVGSLESGLTGNHTMLFTKSALDFVAAIIFASTLGIGVLFSSVFVFAYQGTLTMLAQWVSPLLNETVIIYMSGIGSLVIIGLGINMLGLGKLKVMNFVPAIFIPMLLNFVI